VTEPEDALARARATVAEMRATGEYPAAEARGETEPPATPSFQSLLEWAVVEPDLRNVRSTRRLGAPVTALKRGLLRLLAQYHAELIAEQTRFNVNVLRYVRALEERVEELERRSPNDERQ
jgi:hypothetical protein